MSEFSPQFTITNAITRDLTEIERARGFLEASTLSDEWIARMSERALVLEAHHTTHIEGTQLTLEQSERLLAGEEVAGADPDDVRELLNYRQAFKFVSGYLRDKKPVTEALVREIHRHLVTGVRGDAARPGEYRQVQNYVVQAATGQVIYTPPPPGDVPILMRELIDWLREPSDIHPVLVAGLAQFQLVHIHPFLDGNGRTSRLLSTLCLYRTGYDFKRLFALSEFYDRDRAAFYAALQDVRENDMDLTGWLEFFCVGLATQMKESVERGKRIIKADLLTREHGLNQRQLVAFNYIVDHGSLAIRQFAEMCPEVTRRTLQRDLRSLEELGLIRPSGETNQLNYLLGIDL